MQDVVLSGIQPTGQLHLGNYLGAIKQWLPLQDQARCFFCIVDYHAITVPQNPKTFGQTVLETAAEYLAAGLDPEKASLFVQSRVPEHTELSWIFTTLIPFGELRRMTQWKEKVGSSDIAVNEAGAGLLYYPVLMAADILLYKATLVPVGEDQVQHVELTRIIARKFNNRYGPTFPEPKVKLSAAKRIMSLSDPEKKMSKSHGASSYIALADEPDVIRKKISKAVTATKGGTTMDPGVANLFAILREMSEASVVKEFEEAQKNGTIRYADLKTTCS